MKSITKDCYLLKLGNYRMREEHKTLSLAKEQFIKLKNTPEYKDMNLLVVHIIETEEAID